MMLEADMTRHQKQVLLHVTVQVVMYAATMYTAFGMTVAATCLDCSSYMQKGPRTLLQQSVIEGKVALSLSSDERELIRF